MTAGGPIVATIGHAIDSPIDLSGDISDLKRHISDAMDRMNAALFDLKLDTDDCVVERYLGVRIAGQSSACWLPAVSLTDASIICKAIQREVTDADTAIEIVAVRLEAIRVPDYPDAFVEL